MSDLDIARLTILVPSGPANDLNRKHLHVVLAGPSVAASGLDHIAWVSIQTIYKDAFHDTTCILNDGDHGFVKHPSWVNYRKADVVDANKIQRGIDAGLYIVKDPMHFDVFHRVLTGAQASKHTPQKVKDFIAFASVE